MKSNLSVVIAALLRLEKMKGQYTDITVLPPKDHRYRQPVLRVHAHRTGVLVTLGDGRRSQGIKIQPKYGLDIDAFVSNVDRLLSENGPAKGGANGSDAAAILQKHIPPDQKSVVLNKEGVLSILAKAGIPNTEAAYAELRQTFRVLRGRYGGLEIVRGESADDGLDEDLPGDTGDLNDEAQGLGQQLRLLTDVHSQIAGQLPVGVVLQVAGKGELMLVLPKGTRLDVAAQKRIIIDLP